MKLAILSTINAIDPIPLGPFVKHEPKADVPVAEHLINQLQRASYSCSTDSDTDALLAFNCEVEQRRAQMREDMILSLLGFPV